ncbi:MAG: Rrf2 family transcriptional regulator [Alphaproteobacteria bacterium]|nr:Rrf2 family transcriptional regulator [Alphaproteobacteria bacterium]
MISTRGRYAIRVLLDIAENGQTSCVRMKDVAARQEISLKYLERLATALTQSGLIVGVHGKGGGYRLTRSPEEYAVLEILSVMEGDLAPVACLQCKAPPCPRAENCKTLPMWKELNRRLSAFFADITLADLLNGRFNL